MGIKSFIGKRFKSKKDKPENITVSDYMTKNLIVFSAAPKDFLPAQTLSFLNANHLLLWHKKFGILHNMKNNF